MKERTNGVVRLELARQRQNLDRGKTDPRRIRPLHLLVEASQAWEILQVVERLAESTGTEERGTGGQGGEGVEREGDVLEWWEGSLRGCTG